MRRHLVTPLLLLSLAAAMPARATTLYATGFEPPTFTAGAIAGQDGWAMFGPSSAIVQTAVAKTGTQAVEAFSASSQSGPYYAAALGNPIIDMSADLYLASSTAESDWQFGATGSGLNRFAGGIDVYGTTIHAISGAFPTIGTFTRDTWNHVDVILNFTSQTSTIKLNGVTLASGLAFCGSNGACNGATVAFGDAIFDSFGGANKNDFGLMDNFSLASVAAGVPEPASWALLLLGFGGLGAALRLRRGRVAVAA